MCLTTNQFCDTIMANDFKNPVCSQNAAHLVRRAFNPTLVEKKLINDSTLLPYSQINQNKVSCMRKGPVEV